jgi:hypothetical protein
MYVCLMIYWKRKINFFFLSLPIHSHCHHCHHHHNHHLHLFAQWHIVISKTMVSSATLLWEQEVSHDRCQYHWPKNAFLVLNVSEVMRNFSCKKLISSCPVLAVYLHLCVKVSNPASVIFMVDVICYYSASWKCVKFLNCCLITFTDTHSVILIMLLWLVLYKT